jgi:hypothetical protein
MLTVSFLLILAVPVQKVFADDVYQSPYDVKLPYSVQELIPDILSGERGDPKKESDVPFENWYSHDGIPHIGPWGPLPRAYDVPAISNGKSAEFKRARIIATAMRFVGYCYRHHYIPDWDPPVGWYTPKSGGTRHDGKGVDCSNFTSFIYNQGLGIKFSSDVEKQAAIDSAVINGSDNTTIVQVIPAQTSLEDWKKVLKPGDLIFIRPKGGDSISHVIMWIGSWGVAPEGTALVIDSHGADTRDSNGALIPNGIYLRPFTEKSWYFTNADHAIRIIGD